MRYFKKYTQILILFLIIPSFIATNFGEGCLTCSISAGNFNDFYIYDDFDNKFYLGVTSNGHFIKMDSRNCLVYRDTLLYPQGLNSIEGFQFPFDFIIVAGNSGKILRSNYDSTNIWTNVNSGTNSDLNDIAMCEFWGTIYIVGDNGTILKSTNSGGSFTQLNSGTTLDLNEVQIIGCDIFDDTVRIAGDSLLTLYSTNGGNNWTQQFVYQAGDNSEGFRVDLEAVHFINPNTGWLAGAYYIFRTTNAGQNWSVRFKQEQQYDNSTNSIYFYSVDSGIAVGNRGDIQYTTNRGSNWFYHQETQNLTTKNLNKFVFNRGIAAALGDSGIVIYSDSITLAIEPVGSTVPYDYKLFQNYPNPFNPETHFEFQISDFGLARLVIYDITGREIVTLVNEQLRPGTYKVRWNGANYPSGVYFYKLETGGYTESRKMILIK
ncbi:MAG: YCF48-related protein [Chlorobi bacterium]|nr:YCF48-related protein [Chlorobiota bacterium]MCI0714782.1 YCF48-related protein [Chlorobiota bacterium]